MGSGAILLLGTDGCGRWNEGPVDEEGLWASTTKRPIRHVFLDRRWIHMVRRESLAEARALLEHNSSIPLDRDRAREFIGTMPIASEQRTAFLVRCIQVPGIDNNVNVGFAHSGEVICVSASVWGERYWNKFRNCPVVVFLKKEPKEVHVSGITIYTEVPITEEMVGYWEYRKLIVKRMIRRALRALIRAWEEPAKVGTFLIAICCLIIAVYLFRRGVVLQRP